MKLPFGYQLAKRSQPRTSNPRRKVGGWFRSFFNLGQLNRLTDDWNPSQATADSALRQEVWTIRNRTREQEWNCVWARAYYGALERNVVGSCGYSFTGKVKNRTGGDDKRTNDFLYDEWQKWCEVGNCTADGELSFVDVCNLNLRSTARDGGILTRKRLGKDFGDFGFQLQLYEIDLLDHAYNERLDNGNYVVLGTEKNRYGRPVGYWLLARHPGNWLNVHTEFEGYKRIRIDAADMMHTYMKERPIQSLGLPWLVASSVRINHLEKYEEAEIRAARAGAEKGGWFQSKDGTTFQGDQQQNPDGTTDTLDDFEPSSFDELPEGMTFIPYNPNHPNQAFEGFVGKSLIGIAAGGQVSYATLTGDLTGANYSSLRSGKLEEQENWKKIQRFQIDRFVRPVFNAWLEVQILSRRGKWANYTIDDLDRLKMVQFRGRRWPWVDPQKDQQAAIEGIAAGLTSRTCVLDEQGKDVDDVIEERAAEDKKAAEMGVQVGTGTRNLADVYEILVRSGVITPNSEDEARLRMLAGLPPMSAEVESAWEETEGVRLPSGKSVPAEAPEDPEEEDATDTEDTETESDSEEMANGRAQLNGHHR